MGRFVAVARVAKLLNIGRGELQRLIRNGELQTFEGQLDFDAVKERFPELAVEASSLVERLEMIRATAFSRRVKETVAPERDELTIQLKRRETELAVAKARADRYERLLREMARRLGESQRSDDPRRRELAAELSRWLLARMRR